MDIAEIMFSSTGKALTNEKIALIAAKKDNFSLEEVFQKDLARVQKFLTDHTTPDVKVSNVGTNKLTPKKFRNWSILREFYKKIHFEKLYPANLLTANAGFMAYAAKESKEKVAQELSLNSYAYGIILEIEDIVTKWSTPVSWILDSGTGAALAKWINLLSLTETRAVKIITGKVIDLYIANVLSENEKVYPFFFIGIKTDPSLFKDALNAFGGHIANSDRILHIAYQTMFEERPIPSFFFSGSKMTNPIKSGFYETSSGTAMYIPDVTKSPYKEQREAIAKILASPPSKDGYLRSLPINSIYFADADSESLICTDADGQIQAYSLSDIESPTKKFQLFLLDNKLENLQLRNEGDLRYYLDYSNDEATYTAFSNLLNFGTETKIKDLIGKREYRNFFEAYEQYAISRYSQLSLPYWLSVMGLIHIYKNLSKVGTGILKEHEEQRRKFEAATSKDAPALPNMRTDAVQFPHQAEALAKLNIATDSAIIDIGTGGGKAGILIQDCLNLLNKGLITRPLIVMPNSLIGQFLSEIEFFSDGKVNGFAINSDSENSWGLEDLAKGIRNAPKNTIFLTSFPFLRKGERIKDYDITGKLQMTFGMVRWLRQFGFDYLAVDESQNIKNPGSAMAKSIFALGRGINFKRISTGTLISNKPEDLVGQMMFLDPRLIGSKKQFAEKYAIAGNIKNGFKAGFATEIRNRLKTGSSYIRFTEKDWAALLPKKHYSFEKVALTEEQAIVYKSMVQDIMEEIASDPKLKEAWEKMKESDDELDSIPANLLGKLARLEIFLTAPDSSTLLQYAESGTTSVKMKAIDNLIEKSLKMKGPNNKVLVATHYKDSAKHLWEHSRYKKLGAYYDASKKHLIKDFQDPGSNLKVLFAVIQSVKEGHNFQIANRIIVADNDWAPGNLKQLEARIFRPHVKINGNDVINLNKGKEVYIDTIVADDSADCVKFALQTYKKVENSVIMDECPVDPPQRVKITDDILTARFDDPAINGRQIVDRNKQFNEWNQEVIDQYAAKGNLKFLVTKTAQSNIGTAIADTPWIKGMNLPAGPDEEPMLSFLDSLGMNITLEELVSDDEEVGSVPLEDLRPYADKLIGAEVRVEQGKGKIYSVTKRSLSVWLDKGGKVTSRPDIMLHKIGSVGTSATKFTIRQAALQKPDVSTIRKQAVISPDKRTPRTVNPNSRSAGDDTHNRQAIIDYLTSLGLKMARRTKQSEIILIYNKNGQQYSLGVKCPNTAYKDHSLGEWKDYVSQLFDLVGEETPQSNDDADVEKSKALNTTETRSKNKALSKSKTPKTMDLDDEGDDDAVKEDMEDYLDDEEDFKFPDASRTEESEVTDEDEFSEDEDNLDAASDLERQLDKYLDEDFSFTEEAEDDEEDSKPKGRVQVIINEPEDSDELPEEGITLNIGTYNGFPCLIHMPSEDDEDGVNGEDLQDYSFNWYGNYWSYKVDSVTNANKIIAKLQGKFSIDESHLDEVEKFIGESKTHKFTHSWIGGKLASFEREEIKRIKRGNLRLTPFTVGTELYLIVNSGIHPGVTLSAYRFIMKSGFYLFLAKDLSSLKSTFNKVKKDFSIINLDQIQRIAKTNYKITL